MPELNVRNCSSLSGYLSGLSYLGDLDMASWKMVDNERNMLKVYFPVSIHHTGLTCPFPSIIHLYVVNSFSAIGPHYISFRVLIPISPPSPNCAPLVKAVEVL